MNTAFTPRTITLCLDCQAVLIEVKDGAIDEPCPACGEYATYCAGHGEIGDWVGRKILEWHSENNHARCHPRSDCRRSDANWRISNLAGDYENVHFAETVFFGPIAQCGVCGLETGHHTRTTFS